MTNSDRVLPARASKHHSPFPNFMIMVHSAATVLKPDDAELQAKARDFEKAFVDMWTALALRAEISELNKERFPTRHDRHEPNPEALAGSDANIGTAFLELTHDGQAEVCGEHLNAFSRNHIKGVGDVELPEGWLPVADNPKYEALGRKACTEHRLLNELARRYPGRSLKGSIRIYTERVPCTSCQKVFASFRDDYPDLKIDLTYTYGDSESVKAAVKFLSGINIIVHSVRVTSLRADER